MNVVINLSQLGDEHLLELASLMSDSIDYSIETNEMQDNYSALQEIEYYISERELT